jgi:hypothetical protein
MNSKDDTRNSNEHSSIISAYAIDKLSKAIIYMIEAYKNDNMVSRTQVVNMLEDLIQKLETRKI